MFVGAHAVCVFGHFVKGSYRPTFLFSFPFCSPPVRLCKLRPTSHLVLHSTYYTRRNKTARGGCEQADGGLRHGPTNKVAGGLGGSHLSFCKTH